MTLAPDWDGFQNQHLSITITSLCFRHGEILRIGLWLWNWFHWRLKRKLQRRLYVYSGKYCSHDIISFLFLFWHCKNQALTLLKHFEAANSIRNHLTANRDDIGLGVIQWCNTLNNNTFTHTISSDDSGLEITFGPLASSDWLPHCRLRARQIENQSITTRTFATLAKIFWGGEDTRARWPAGSGSFLQPKG